MSKENKSRYPWQPWANFEAVDSDRRTWQYSQIPEFEPESGNWKMKSNTRVECVGLRTYVGSPAHSLITRHPDPTEQPVIAPSSQPTPAPENDYEETPFIPNRAEAWARFMAASIARENIRNIDEAAGFADRALAEYEARFLNQ